MKKINILFLIIATFIVFGICMCLSSCTGESKPTRALQSSKIFHIDGCDVYYIEITHDSHEYLISNSGGMIHKVNCKFCVNKGFDE